MNQIHSVIPDIILNKIYYYLWLLKQRELCHEYKKTIIKQDRLFFYEFDCWANVFNYRNTDNYINYHAYIWNFKNGNRTDHKLPKNFSI